MRNVAILTIVTLCASYVAAQNGNNVSATAATTTIIGSGETSLLRVMDPSEKIAINGYVVQVSDLLPLLSADSASAPHLRIPENHSREASQPTLQPSQADQHSHPAAKQAAIPASAPNSEACPSLATKPQRK